MEQFKNKIIELIEKFDETQENTLNEVAKVIVDQIQDGGKFYAVGTGHSHMVGEEFYARAGGLACISLIAPMELTLGEHPLKSTQIERIAAYANVIVSQYKIKKGDIVMISSNSGRNSLPIEMAIVLKSIGVKTIAFTNLQHSKGVTSRHVSGKRLFEVCDYVIDNCGCVGDAMMELEGVKGKMGASSSIIGMYMAQTLSMMIATEMHKRNLVVPVFLSANVDAGDKWNEDIMKEYYDI
ncbi:MAG: SIS domain-containing protein [Thomasclavelia sp.]|jgi:uncharacterized phosphosugar-binding protein|nr:SIS domain-containing protein [Thomasclavelia sp.]